MQFQRDHLETLLAVVDEGTFDAAAARLRVTPSAVSQRIKALETSTGRVLVRRTTPITPTDDGFVVLRHARQVRLLDDETGRALGVDASDAVPTISLAVNADSLATWFLDALADVRQGHEVVFDLHREDQDRTALLLRAGTVMAAVTATATPVQGCTVTPLGVMRYHAVAAPEFVARYLSGGATRHLTGAATRRSTEAAALADLLDRAPLVDFDRSDDLQHGFLRSVLGRDPVSPRHFVPTSADFAHAVELGFGWGLLPEQQSAVPLADGRLVHLAEDRPADVALYWQRWNLASPLLDRISASVLRTAAATLRPTGA